MLLKNLTKNLAKKSKQLSPLTSHTQKRDFASTKRFNSHFYMHQPGSTRRTTNVTLIPGIFIGPEITGKKIL